MIWRNTSGEEYQFGEIDPSRRLVSSRADSYRRKRRDKIRLDMREEGCTIYARVAKRLSNKESEIYSKTPGLCLSCLRSTYWWNEI